MALVSGESKKFWLPKVNLIAERWWSKGVVSGGSGYLNCRYLYNITTKIQGERTKTFVSSTVPLKESNEKLELILNVVSKEILPFKDCLSAVNKEPVEEFFQCSKTCFQGTHNFRFWKLKKKTIAFINGKGMQDWAKKPFLKSNLSRRRIENFSELRFFYMWLQLKSKASLRANVAQVAFLP